MFSSMKALSAMPPAAVLFDKITAESKCDGAPRKFSDYEISVDRTMPAGVELIEKI